MTSPSYHPINDSPVVWYLAHPVAPDDRFTYDQNMEHALKMLRLCYDEGFRCIAPWHTLCLTLPDSDPECRRIGLEIDCTVAGSLGRIVMTGHKISSGMKQEVEAVYQRRSMLIGTDRMAQYVLDLTHLDDDQMRAQLQLWRKAWVIPRIP